MTSPSVPSEKKALTNSLKSKGKPDTMPSPGGANGTIPVEERAPLPAGPVDCGNAGVFFQGFFKFVSTSRTMMRPAKRTAKIAQIKRLAELEHATDGECKGRIPSSGMLDNPGLDLLAARMRH